MATEPKLPEITVKAVILAVILSIVLAGANAYLGLFAGMTVSASIPAAVLSMGILRWFRKNNILENNIVQTAASAGESLAAGVIFTLPALVIMDYWDHFSYGWVTLIAGFGGLLGVLFTIPLRRALILESDLKFPEGIATAEVLESGQRGGKDVGLIVKAALAGGLFKLGAGSGLRVLPDIVEAAARTGRTVFYVGSNLSPALLAVGYIVGLNVAVLIVLGGVLNWLVAIPIVAALGSWPTYPVGHELAGQALSAIDCAGQLWSEKTRYLGVGGMLVGGLWTVIKLRGSLLSGIRSGLRAYRAAGGTAAGQPSLDRTEQDLPMKWVLILIIASIVPLFWIYQLVVGRVVVTLPMAAVMLVLGFLFSAVAAYMAGLVGSSNNPISGVTIATVTLSALLLVVLLGQGQSAGPPAAIIIGAVVCCAAAIAGDNMQDLKAGQLVRATAWKQQVMQMVGTVTAALVMGPILMVLYKAYGFAGHSSAKDTPLIAAQANLMASVARGVFNGRLPWAFVGLGALLAGVVIVLDETLARRGTRFRTPVLAVTIGIYLPLELEVPILIGGLVAWAIQRAQRRREFTADQTEHANRRGLLFASGLITGEALVGILLAVLIVVTSKKDCLALFPLHPSVLVRYISGGLGLFFMGVLVVWLMRIGRDDSSAS